MKFALVVDTLAENDSAKSWPDYLTAVLDVATPEEYEKEIKNLMQSLQDYEELQSDPNISAGSMFYLCLSGDHTEIISEKFLKFLPDNYLDDSNT